MISLKQRAILTKYYELMYNKYIVAETSSYDPNKFDREKYSVFLEMEEEAIPFELRKNTSDNAKKKAFKYLKK